MKRLGLILALGSVCAWSLEIPRIGFARDAQGRVVAVNGIAGNFLLDETSSTVAAAAFSWNGSYGVRKTDTAVELWGSTGTTLATLDAPAGDAVIGFGVTQDVWLYSNSLLYRVSANELRMQQVPVSLSSTDEEVVLALAGGRETIDIALRRAGAVFIATFNIGDGSRLMEVPVARSASTAIVFLGDGRLAGVDGSTLWLTRGDGSEWSADTGAPLTSLAWMGREWLQAGPNYALRIRSGSEPALYMLPVAVTE